MYFLVKNIKAFVWGKKESPSHKTFADTKENNGYCTNVLHYLSFKLYNCTSFNFKEKTAYALQDYF